jgi:muramidase (phage lysozyme)
LSKIVQAIKSGFSGDSSSIDPSIEAMREVGQVLEPVGKVAEFTLRPFGFRSKEKNKPLSREEERHNRRQIRLLERIARMSRGGSNGGLGSGLAGGLLGGLLRGAGGLLLRAVMSPIALLAGAFFGGYKLGEIIAPKISEWTDSLIKADIPKRISNAWDTFTGGLSDYFKEKINNIKENTKEVVNDAKDTVGSVGDFAAAKTDEFLAKFGVTKQIRKDAQDRVAQRDRGEIGFTPQNYKAKTTNNTSLGQVAADTGQALTTQPSGHKYAPLLDEIAKGESLSGAFGTSGYDAVYGGAKVKPSKPVSQMTIGEVKEYQKQLIKAGSGSSAVGRYQFIKNDDAFAKMTMQAGLKDTDIFDATAQDRLAVHYMGGEKKVDELLKTGNDAALANVVARQWASMQNASGRGNYDGDRIGNFARHGGISAMQKARQQILANEAQPKPTNTVLTKAPTPIVNGLTTTPLAMLPKAQAPAFSLMRPTQQVEVKPSVVSQTQQAQKPTTQTAVLSTQTPVINTLTAAPLALALPKVQAPAFSLMRPTQKITTNPTAISQTQHKIAAPQIPKPESVKEPIGTPSPMMVRNVDNGQQITQNLSDRHLAHLVTGGLGMTDRWIR